MDLYKSTAHELHDKLVKKEISSVELTNALYERIDAVEDQVRAYVTLDKENALEQAAKVDAMIAGGEKIAPLAGIPGAIKDNICTKGLLTTCSSKMLSNVVPIYDAHVIKKLRAEETIFLGKTNMDEFAMGSTTESSYFQATHNPWNLDRVPGGSSGGSAAAIAAGEAIWTLGSDTGGSIRQPASFNGCVGIKPTYGRVSRYGCVAFASSLDQIGPITRDVTDAATVLNTICGKDEHDSTSLPVEVPDFTKALRQDVKGLRIGLPKEYYGEGLDPKVHAELKKAIAQYEAMGAEIVEISLPHTEYAVITYYIIAPAEASANLARYDGVRYGFRAANATSAPEMTTLSRTEGFGPEVKRRIMLGTYVLSSGYYDAYYKKAMQVRTLIRRDFDSAFAKCDVILAPTSPVVAYPIDGKMDPLSIYMLDVYTIPVNMAGLPGISVPCGFADGMPVGMQLIGKPLDEETVLRAAYTFEQANDYHKVLAPLGGNK
ncbi:MAG: Asp-tRNA(Asn)/Glu-tRNA(Gln) amidotransferase subunit GatA [Phascolarctobacterium sp.]|uniref:Asp-tRNA(Asn)/Glu-tRNA(Gln) amidotransferase subunit GatA n=1 Tax=Phascolarctobacterium sp. TaxID=2049039 RepID=UPI0025D084B5|nr:Asp-tRNA(Asn)/Glu-tRNA(Gln) amidotransferase subunit GatA [Phascolarctobacterium sp.]MCC8157746.1 Asp-tRNA(Asn)/Glu-tRNA(Gln) amidotransferase subunit GatA [Phascolarctobacterium sp.]